VRGDSLRDFYAKVLAILGLGALAGVGALVDYWPVGVTPPPLVATGDAWTPEVPRPTPVADAPAPIEPRVTAMQPALSTMVARVAKPVPAPIPVSPAAVPATGSLPLGEGLLLAEPPAFVAPPVPAAAASEAPDAQLVELAPPPMPVEIVPSQPAAKLNVAADDSGFLMDTLRKTGSGIVRSGAVAGASIADAFRSVLGAFKKVRPFKDSAFGTNN
jgi:hypothetical protein